MASVLYRLGWASARHWRLVIVSWLVVLAACVAAAIGIHGELSSGFSLPPTAGSRVLDTIEAEFPDAHLGDGAATAVIQTAVGETVTGQSEASAITDLVGKLESVAGVHSALSPFVSGAISENSQYALIEVRFDTPAEEVTVAQKEALDSAANEARDSGLTVEFGGPIFQGIPPIGLNEGGGLIIALIVLLVTLRGVVAAVIPITSGVIGVAIGVSALLASSGVIDVNVLTPLLPAMLGLAVGIDYSLFVISRYQNELADGHPREIAIARAVGTAGTAVVFAGLTVLIALAALSTVGLTLLVAMGLAAAGTVAISILIAVTLTPALLTAAGPRVKAKTAQHAEIDRDSTRDDRSHRRAGLAERWIRLVTRVPALTMIATLLVLGALTVPAFQMRLSFPDNSMAATDTTQYRASQLISSGFGAGFTGPLLVLVTGADATEVATDLVDDLGGLSGVDAVFPPLPNEADEAAIVRVIPEGGPLAESTADLVAEIRDRSDEWAASIGARSIEVTGQTVIDIDSGAAFSAALVPYLSLVVVLALLLLLVMFRSILVPLKAALGFLLTIGATFGVIVAVFQWGWGAELLGVHTQGPIVSLLPLALTGVLFGLAMDYEVFIVSRMREEFRLDADAQRAVRVGFVHGARVVVAAAIIMISVFAGFIVAEDTFIKSIAFALAVGVFIDAVIVRATLVPAVMALLGSSAWWLPRWLDRILPTVDTEGSRLTESRGRS